MKRLFICEKPSMAKALADYLAGGANKAERKNGYFEVADSDIAWLKGHIMALYEPEDYTDSWARSNFSTSLLPMIPDDYKKKIKTSYGKDENGKDRITDDYTKILSTIKSLSKKADVIVNSGDADAEGQVLVDEVIEEINWQGKEERIFITAYDNDSIKRALDNIEDNKSSKNANLSKSALCRSITDWLIGMNGSRKFSSDAGTNISVGRVKVPILALVKRRNEEISRFESKEFYEAGITAVFGDSSFSAKWKAKEDCEYLDEENRLTDKTFAESLIEKVNNKDICVVDVVKTHKKESQPLPFNLAKLQEYACSKLGISLKEFDVVLQALYEEKKLLTYPRSDCQYIPESQFDDAKKIVSNLLGFESLSKIARNADTAIKSRAFDSSKTTAHHAIIPTMVKVQVENLSKVELEVYKIVAKRYLQQFYPLYEYDLTEITLECESETFVAKGKLVTEFGWKKLVDAADDAEKEDVILLPELEKGEVGKAVDAKIVVKNTTPPKNFTQEILIAALTNAYKYVYDKRLAEVIKSIKGIGTPATRSVIIGDLLAKGLLVEKNAVEQGAKGKKKYLYVSDRASELVDFLPNSLTYPDQTALMELELEKVSAGTMTFAEYRKDIEGYIKSLMKVEAHFKLGEKCPSCGKGYLKLSKDKTKWFCSRWNAGEDKCDAVFANVDGKPMVFHCPTCKTGYLKLAKSGENWYCSNWNNTKMKCSEVFLNVKGKPYTEKCPSCGKGYIRKSKAGRLYCSNYVNGCKASFILKAGVPVLGKEYICPVCGKGTLHKNRFGSWSCSGWKEGCKAVFEDVGNKPYTKKCTVCGEGYLRKSQKGNWYCSNFKTCKSFYIEEKGKPVLKK